MASDCSNNGDDCLPVGANPADPCSPCFEPTPANFQSALAELARQQCALGNMMKAWNQRIDKFRNRMDRLEDTLDNLPGSEDTPLVNPCSSVSDALVGMDVLFGCKDGGQVGLTAGEDGDEFDVIACGGLWKKVPRGLRFYPRDTSVINTTVYTASYAVGTPSTITLPDYPTDACGAVWVLTQTSSTIAPITLVYSSSTLRLNGFTIGYVGADYSNTNVGYALTPTNGTATPSMSATAAGSGQHWTHTVRVFGYFY